MSDPGPLQVFDEASVRARLVGDLRHWRFDHGSICRTYRTGGWKGSLMVTNAIGLLAESAWHHPELRLTYPQVEVRLDTHDAGGITERDFELARLIEALVQWHPGQDGGPFEGAPAAQAIVQADD